MKIVLVPVIALLAGLGWHHTGQDADAQDPTKPGPEHKIVQQHVGAWDAVVITQTPDGKEARSKATMTIAARGAFHAVEEFSGTFMDMPFTGTGVSGWCPLKKQYFTFWVDSMVASPLHLWGSYDEKGRTLTMTGECVGMSGKLEPCRTVTTFQDADHYQWAMYGTGPDGTEAQHLRIEYTRKK